MDKHIVDAFNQSIDFNGSNGNGVNFKSSERVLPISTSNFYDNFLDAWELGKQKVLNDLDNAVIADEGGILTAAAAFVKFPAEYGFGLLDAGLALGGIVASPNVRQY